MKVEDRKLMNPRPETIRAFVAILLPEELVKRLAALQEELQSKLPAAAVRWTRPEQIHLTLKFLGNVEKRRLAELTAALQQACQAVPALRLRAQGLGFFPPRQPPRVIWIGVHDGSRALHQLQHLVEEAAGTFTQQKPADVFTGHLTIGRAKNLSRGQAERLADFSEKIKDRVLGEWKAETVELMRSQLSPEGSRHSCLASISINKVE